MVHSFRLLSGSVVGGVRDYNKAWVSVVLLLGFRTTNMSNHLSSYKLGNDTTFLTKVTKTIFGRYLDTYVRWAKRFLSICSHLWSSSSVLFVMGWTILIPKRIAFGFIPCNWAWASKWVPGSISKRFRSCLNCSMESRFLKDKSSAILHRYYESRSHQKKQIQSGGWGLWVFLAVSFCVFTWTFHSEPP